MESWLQTQLNWREEPGSWLAGSLLAHMLAANLAWLLAHRKGALGSWAARLRAWPGTTWLLTLLRWTFFVAPPYAALLLGIVTPSSLGWAEIDWVRSVAAGGASGALALGLLCLGWWSYRRGLPSPEELVSEAPLLARPVTWLLTMAETASLQLHWAFYRSAAIGLALPLRPQWGEWVGLSLVYLGWLLNPWLHHELRIPVRAEPILRRAVVALVTTAYFVLTHNFWLCWALHTLFEAGALMMGGQKHRQTRSLPVD